MGSSAQLLRTLAAPKWRLEAAECGDADTRPLLQVWRLIVVLPEGCPAPPELGLHHNEIEVHLEAVDDVVDWKIAVPEYAQPVHSPTCKFARRHKELCVEWRQT